MHPRIERIDETGVLLDIEGLDATRLLSEGERAHRELRPYLPDDYATEMLTLLDSGAYLTQLVSEHGVVGIALWRIFNTTYVGRKLDIDDLVVAERARSRGHGATLLHWLEQRALQLDCSSITLNSANHRVDAHRFYKRERFDSIAAHFSKNLKR